MNRYSLEADGRRWWWKSASAGLVASTAITAILTAPVFGSATPDRRDYDGVSHLPSAPAPADTRPCFIVQDQWNEALDGPQPTCPQDMSEGYAAAEARRAGAVGRTARQVMSCPGRPDTDYVGVPWVSSTRDCPHRWWEQER